MNDIIKNAVLLLLTLVPKDLMKGLLDKILDYVEDAVTTSENKWDDAVVLPLCSTIRKQLEIPDNDVEENSEVNA